nr:uncharacterized protein LOC119165424 [Rhipicephalus microplus]
MYVEDMCRLFKRADPNMTEEKKLRHLMRGVKQDLFAGLVRNPPRTVAEFRTEATTIEKALQQRARHYNRDASSAPVDVLSAGQSNNSETLRELVRSIVREEIQKLMQPQVMPTVSTLAAVIRDEVRHAILQPEPEPQPVRLEQPLQTRRMPTAEGVGPDPDKTAAVARFPKPRDKKECGLGGCAPTQTANPFTLVMQVSKTYSLLAKKSSNYLLFQLPSPHCCVLVALECSRVIRALLMMSGDIESNPGPASNAVLTELQKLSAGQTELISQVQDLKSHLLSTDKSIADLSRRMTDLEGHCQNIISLRTDVEALRRDTARASDLLRKLEARVDEAENHSRRNNLIFYGLPESTGSEALVQVEQLVIKHCRDRLGISIDPKEIERAHRLGRRKGTNHHRPIIVKFAFHKTKGEILSNGRKFKGTTFSVGEDFSRRVQNVRRQLIAFAKTKSLPFSITYKTLLMGHKRYVYDEQSQTVREAS